MADKAERVAGTIDLVRVRPDGTVDIYDFKTKTIIPSIIYYYSMPYIIIKIMVKKNHVDVWIHFCMNTKYIDVPWIIFTTK